MAPNSSTYKDRTAPPARRAGHEDAANAGFCALGIEEAAAECVSEDALVHLKSYKYSSVDKSPVSYYILRPYVCPLPNDAVSRRQ